MKEISLRELLDFLLYNDKLTTSGKRKLRDYITNLQQENERLKENNMSYQEEMARTWKIADDYKSRIEKTEDYISQYDGQITGYYYSKENKKFLVEENVKDDLLNILNGSDKNEKD